MDFVSRHCPFKLYLARKKGGVLWLCLLASLQLHDEAGGVGAQVRVNGAGAVRVPQPAHVTGFLKNDHLHLLPGVQGMPGRRQACNQCLHWNFKELLRKKLGLT